jgi:hypothetical protein
MVEEAALASERNRLFASSLDARCGGRNLRATSRPSLVSRALYKAPMAPDPSSSRIS